MTKHHSDPGPAASPAARALVADEQLRLLLENSRSATVVAGTFVVILAVYLHGSTPVAWVWGWAGLKLALAALRFGAATGQLVRGPVAIARGAPLTYALLAADGLLWGIAGAWMMSQPVPVASLFGAALAGITCVATFGLQVKLQATAAYCGPVLVPTALGLMARGDDMGLIGGPGMLLLLGQQLWVAKTGEQRFASSLLLRQAAQTLAAEREAALQLAQRQSSVKTQFLAKISHELRTPLHGILGLARLIHRESPDPVVLHRVELIESSGTHLLGLINDLLDVSRVEQGRFTLRSAPFDAVAQLQRLADVFSVRSRDKGLVFEFVSEVGADCWVQGDVARFRQVLHNLLGNAIKFTHRGGVELRLARGAVPGTLQVEVRDTGVGIPPEALRHIFEAFNQAEGETDDPASGAGLGLTIAKEIAQAMGGDISVASEPGVGSRFVFTARLPELPPPPASAGGRPAPPHAIGRRLRQVLIAEDEDVNALILETLLRQAGIDSERVADGLQVVGRALRETERPDLVLMDCRMPLLDGYAATREIRQQEQTLGLPHMPIIALTATDTPDERLRCREAGMDDFLAKPYAAEELMAMLARWGGERGAVDAGASSGHAPAITFPAAMRREG